MELCFLEKDQIQNDNSDLLEIWYLSSHFVPKREASSDFTVLLVVMFTKDNLLLNVINLPRKSRSQN